jgi:hypothetical protein
MATDAIKEILAEKRKLDKENMEVDAKASRGLSDAD